MRVRVFKFILFFIIPMSCFAAIKSQRVLELIGKVQKVYDQNIYVTKILNENHKKLNVLFMEDDDYVFGFEGIWGQAYSSGDIYIAGGVRNNTFFTEETLVALICHEVGHILGGWPHDESFLSFEGQADYYAGNVCMKLFYRAYPEELAKKAYIHQYYFDQCSKVYSSKNDIRICAKIMQGGLNLGIASSLAIEEILLPGPASSETYETDETLEGRDSSQCIVDTFEAGALCNLDPFREIDFMTNDDHYCSNRPKCWFKKARK